MSLTLDVRPTERMRARPASGPQAAVGVIDCDIHPSMRSLDVLADYLPTKWRTHFQNYGLRMRQPFVTAPSYPKATPALSRLDSWPPTGGPPGSDLAFMREQLLDAHNVIYGVLHTLFPVGMMERNLDFGAAVCGAVNDWQYAEWTQPEPRLKGSINVQGEDPEAAVAEIERWADNGDFVQVAMVCRAIEPLGRKRYWPIYEAAERHGLPVGLHLSGENGYAQTGTGWPSYYAENHHSSSMMQRSLAASLILEGVFEVFPSLKIVLVEGGFAWIPAWSWRLDHQWERMRDEVPHLKRRPSEYLKSNFWFTTQPVDEPEKPEHLRDIIDWIGWDRLLFASDYPHWDFDDPALAFRIRMSPAERRMLTVDNARALYGLS